MSIEVNVPGKGTALVDDGAEFLYIDRWSELTSWLNQEPPVEGDIVWIPDGQVILLDVFTPILSVLYIEGALYFDSTQDVSLDAQYVFIYGGLMQIGTAEVPHEKSVTITLHGDRYTSIELPLIGVKCLAVASKGFVVSPSDTGLHLPGRNQGQLEVHGKKRLRTWTKLSETAYAGQNYIVTSEEVDFVAGERLVLPGSEGNSGGLDIPGFQIEDVYVKENRDGFNITLTAPLSYTHRSEIIYVEGRTIDLRCEVGLISRNIIIQGDNEKSVGQMFGIHTVAMMSGIYRIENAEIRHCGQVCYCDLLK
jgi:hypothetical protein